MSRRRHLTDEEQALWSGFVRSVTPLRGLQKSAGPVAVPEAQRDELPPPPKARAENPSRGGAAKTLPLSPLGRRLRQRVVRGREAIDARIDLHGMTQNQAHAALFRFLRGAQADGARIVLVVTGKGSGASAHDPAIARGVLRRQVPLWLSLPDFRGFVVGFEDAHVGHGGQGALYVRLRRVR